MARYRKIDPRIWNDRKFRALSDDGKLSFLFVLTHPRMTSVGAMMASIPGLASELGWSPSRFSPAFDEFEGAGMVRADRSALLVWLPNFIRYNAPESPNVAAAWRDQLDELPECEMLAEIVAAVEGELAQLGGSFVDAWTHGKRRHAGKPDLGVIQMVRQRDGDNCRYCGVPVNWKDRKGGCGGTYDHVDPRGASTVENIVVACRKCNSKKALRTPAQARMFLMSPGSKSRSDLDVTQITPGNQEQDPDPEPEQDPEQEQDGGGARADENRPPTGKPTKAAEVCLAVKAEGIIDASPSYQPLLALLEEGAETEEFVQAARASVAMGKGFRYVVGKVRGQRQDAAQGKPTGLTGPLPGKRPRPDDDPFRGIQDAFDAYGGAPKEVRGG